MYEWPNDQFEIGENIIEQFVFFPNKELKKTPSNIDIIYEDVFLNLNNKGLSTNQ